MKPTILDRLNMAVRRAICRVFGHVYVSDDWATPDSGGMGGHCERCDWGFWSPMY